MFVNYSIQYNNDLSPITSYSLGCLNSNFLGSSNLFKQIVSNNSNNLVLQPMRATNNWFCGKHIVIRKDCSNGALGATAKGVILFCGEISSKFVVDRVNIWLDGLDKPFDAEW